jgi:hypothetical protein
LLEAPTIQLAQKAVLAANGGGGGVPSGTATPGAAGSFDDLVAYGADSNQYVVYGGNGAAKDGLDGGAARVLPESTAAVSGMGGGGAVGRIRLNSIAGEANVIPLSVISPSFASGAATQGTLTLR